MVRGHNLGLTTDIYISSVTFEAIAEEVRKIGNLAGENGSESADQVDAVILGCSGFRACVPGFIDHLEKVAGGIPVVTSTQAILWDSLRLAGVQDIVQGFGTLFQKTDCHDANLVPQ